MIQKLVAMKENERVKQGKGKKLKKERVTIIDGQ